MKKSYTLNDKNTMNILKDSFTIGGSVLLTGVGVYGVIVFGKNLVDYYNAGYTLSLKSVAEIRWHEAKFWSSFMPIAFGGAGIYNGVAKLSKDLKCKEFNKKYIKKKDL